MSEESKTKPESATAQSVTHEGDAGEARVMHADAVLAALAEEFASAESEVFEAAGASWDIVTVSVDDYHGFVAAAHASGSNIVFYLCAVG